MADTTLPITVDSGGVSPLQRIAKPWGEELILARRDGSVVKMLRIRAAQRLSLQYHRQKHETLMLLSGDAHLTAGAAIDQLRESTMQPGQAVDVAPGVIHRLAAGPNGAEVLEIATRLPNDTEDIVRLADDYGRVQLDLVETD